MHPCCGVEGVASELQRASEDPGRRRSWDRTPPRPSTSAVTQGPGQGWPSQVCADGTRGRALAIGQRRGTSTESNFLLAR